MGKLGEAKLEHSTMSPNMHPLFTLHYCKTEITSVQDERVGVLKTFSNFATDSRASRPRGVGLKIAQSWKGEQGVHMANDAHVVFPAGACVHQRVHLYTNAFSHT